jgi:uncharacterized protein YqhQ
MLFAEKRDIVEETIMPVGGQAVIEGVMMRSKDRVATAVRKPDGEIIVHTQSFRSLIERRSWLNIPVLRGAITLVEVMALGIKTLNFSADVAMAAEAEEQGKTHKKSKGMSNLETFATVAFALLLGVALFFVGPLFITSTVFAIDEQAFAFNLVSGSIRLVFFLAYIGIISKLPDVKRLFQYHGAEHKSIYAFEERASLQVSDAREFTTLHPRCGTSFLVMVMLISILFFSIVDSIALLYLNELNFLTRLLLHLPLIPVVGGIAYEAIKASAKMPDHPLVRLFILPGLMLQKVTTREPDDSQLEVALTALKAALGEEWESEVATKQAQLARLSA